MEQTFGITVPLKHTVTSNRTAQTWKRQQTKEAMKALTEKHAAGLEPVGRASIYVGIFKRTAGKYDPINTADTWKGMVDHLVRMGVLDEDDWTHVLGPIPYHAGIDRSLEQGTLRAIVTLGEYRQIPAEVTA